MQKKVKFVYFGSSQFSTIILEGLYAKGIVPSLVVSKPPRPKGRGLKLCPTEVSLFDQRKGVPFITPQSLNDSETIGRLDKEAADFFIIADYGNIIPKSLILLPKIFSLAIHPSLLPRYRGPAPIEYALLNGDAETGVTIFRINEKIDAGEVILQERTEINVMDDFFSLRQKLACTSILLLIKAFKKIDANEYKLIAQDENKVTFTHKLNKEDGRIDWNWPALRIRNLIRAIKAWPSAYTCHNNLMLKILTADVAVEEVSVESGRIVRIDKEGIYVATAKDILKVCLLKPQGKKEMTAWAFVCGHKLKIGDRFG